MTGLPESPDMEEFTRIWQCSHDLNPLPLTLAPAMMQDTKEVRWEIRGIYLNGMGW